MNRRGLLGLGAITGAAGLGGLGAGYVFHRPIQHLSRELRGLPEAGVSEFDVNARQITERQRRQTAEDVTALKRKYEGEILGKFRVWDLLQKLSLCIDPTDSTLLCTSQHMHVCQILAGMERDGELDDSMLMAALLHDLGKVAMLAGEAPEHVVCFTRPVEEQEPGAGLDNIIFQFGHDEIAYSRFKDEVPEHIAWMLRYHSMIIGAVEKYMSPQDRDYEDKYLAKFRRYDQGTKSPSFLPASTTLDRYRDFVEDQFPRPLLF
jgi:hypothetical protein